MTLKTRETEEEGTKSAEAKIDFKLIGETSIKKIISKIKLEVTLYNRR